MLFYWLVALIVFAALVITLYSDAGSAKKKHSDYFQRVQKPAGKAERDAVIPNPNKYDPFYTKLNSL
ncbi:MULTISPECIES: hypothetical protein [Desulfosporosinus]|uniref:Uncharacterized protein n=2 Tax=Desulfosporosinus TaxID=79206 RepID=A0A1G7XMK4_9FIRM|nr:MULTISPECIES: hypothetical protein [Desulfosporosinus]AFQ44532.1 hypothetical protein Desmer_2618 [Desulfosporosinus meridiei DSM 13257]KGK89764.1 hypothetical protein DP73_09015 [Desulfosporosinus sp. HMP52]SDG85273.1 hypothetical protein SAMN05443529_10735 [Desulfosporosinus hippei DSM 8344]